MYIYIALPKSSISRCCNGVPCSSNTFRRFSGSLEARSSRA